MILPAGSMGGSLGEFFQDEKGRPTVNLIVKGSLSDPNVGLDKKSTGQQAIKALKGNLGQSLFKTLGLPMGGGSSPTPSPPSNNAPPPAEDQTKQQVEDLLKGLFKH
jgi:hypothetical protein